MMKKILLILALFISLASYSQGVKISAMPQWTSSLDSVWFPIIYNNGTTWINYRAQGFTLFEGINARVDSLVNNWPAGGFMRFGYPAEDVLANETRDFDQNANPLIIHGDYFEHYVGDLTEVSVHSILYHDGSTLDAKAGNGSATDDWRIQAYRNGTGGRVDISATSAAGQANIQIGNQVGWSALVSITAPTGNLRFVDLIDSAQSYQVFINPSNWKVTYAAATTGGGGGGIQSIEGNNGVTVLTDSIVQLGANNNSGVAFTGNRWINTSTSVLTIRGSSSLWPLQVENTGNAYAASFTTNAGVATRTQSLPADVSTIKTVADFIRAGTGSSSAGIGGGIDTYVWIDNTNGSTYAGTTYFTLTNTTYATRSSDFGIKVVNNTATSTAVLVKASGNLELQGTGKAYGLKSPDGTVWYIKVDNAGALSTTTTAP